MIILGWVGRGWQAWNFRESSDWLSERKWAKERIWTRCPAGGKSRTVMPECWNFIKEIILSFQVHHLNNKKTRDFLAGMKPKNLRNHHQILRSVTKTRFPVAFYFCETAEGASP